jgi:hypothetical protein
MRPLFATLAMVFVLPAFAQDTERKESLLPPPPQIEDFSEVYVEGQLIRPSAGIVSERIRATFPILIELRPDFDREMQESVYQVR